MQETVAKFREKFSNQVIKSQEKSTRRQYIEFLPPDIPEAARFLFKDLNCRFATASGIDTPEGIEILYHFSDDHTGEVISLRTILTDKKDPQIHSIATIFPAAEWIEREIWELLGVKFIGHPNLKHLLLIDDWPEGKHPLRKKE